MSKPLFSVALPTCTEGLCSPVPFSNREVIERISRRTEELGYHSVWGNDHLSTQKYVRDEWDSPPNYFEPLIALAFAGGVTDRIKLGTSVTVLPMREPTLLAKQVMTLDHFTNGRVLLGVGVGAYREEFEAVLPRVAQGAERGGMVSEGIQALQVLFKEKRASFEGKYYEFHDVEMYPKPVQDPLPIYVGGNSMAATVRAGKWGQGWLPAGAMVPDEIRERVQKIYAEAEKAGRQGVEIDIAPQFVVQIGKTAEEASKKYHESWLYQHLLSLKDSTFKDRDLSILEEHDLVGTPERILEKIEAFTQAGVTHYCSLIFGLNSVAETLEQMEWFAEEIIPRV